MSEKALIRLLNAFAWAHGASFVLLSSLLPLLHCNSSALVLATDDFAYVQGMNVLAAPFLYVFPSELEAFFAFDKFIVEQAPTYCTPSLTGVHKGLQVRVPLSERRKSRGLTLGVASGL